MVTAVFANVPAKFSMSSTGAGCQARLKPMGEKNTTRKKRRVLPVDAGDVPVLILSLDQGFDGSAGLAYGVHNMQARIFPKRDKLHRMVRDLKLSKAMGPPGSQAS